MRLTLPQLGFARLDARRLRAGARPALDRAWHTAHDALRSPQALVALLVIVPTLLAGFLGMIVALGSPQLVLIVAGSVAGLALLFVPSRFIVNAILLISIVGVGNAMYYAKVNQAHWVPYALSLFLWIKLPMDTLSRQSAQAGPLSQGAGMQGLARVLLCIFVLVALTIVVNQTSMLSAMVGARNYFYIWSIAFIVSAGALSPQQLRTSVLMLLALVALQGLFAAQQHLGAYGKTGNWDAVVGTFGGNPDGGGGGSGDMVIFVCFGMALATALWMRNQLSGKLALVVVLSGIGATMLAETKAFFIFATVAISVVLLGQIRRRPGLVLMVGLATALLLGATLAFYKHTYFDSSTVAGRDASLSDYFDYAVSADSKTSKMINDRTGEVSRLGAPLVWLREGGVGGSHGWFIGYGPRASNVSALLGKGEAARHFSFSLTTSSVTTLLWDVGPLGLMLYVVLIGFAGISARRLARSESIPQFHRATLEAMSAGFAISMVSLPYNQSLIDSYSLQTVFAFSVGYVMYWQRVVAGGVATRQ